MTRDQLHAAPWPAKPWSRGLHRKMLATIEDYLNINGPYLTAAQAASRLGVTERTIHRYRAFLRGLASQTPGGTT